MTPRPLPRNRFALLLAANTLFLAGAAHAETAFPVPLAAYPGDSIGVPMLSGGACQGAVIDPARAPEIRQTAHLVNNAADDADDVYEYDLSYWLVEPQTPICGTPPPPGYHSLIDVGDLPEGIHRFDVTGYLAGTQFASYTTADVSVQEQRRPGNDISGIWWADEQSGRGFTVMRSGDIFALYWATHDDDGEPEWVTLLRSGANEPGNTFEGVAINTDGPRLAPGAAALTPRPWGEVSFTYEGCGRASFEWNAIDPNIVDGSLALTQIATPDGVESCDIGGRAVATAQWITTP